MKKTIMTASTAVIGTALAVSVASPVYAWHPEGKIVKQVTNVTAGTAMSDANSTSTAVAAKPGDTLKYTVTVSNPAKPADKQANDLAFVKLTDILPEGLELVKSPEIRKLSQDLGTIAPGKTVTKEFTVKVTATKNTTIENKACFAGDSIVKDAPRNGCDVAIVKVTVPETPVTPPVTPPTPAAPQTPAPAGKGSVETPTELPKTGPASILATAGAAVVAGYAANILRLRAIAVRNR